MRNENTKVRELAIDTSFGYNPDHQPDMSSRETHGPSPEIQSLLGRSFDRLWDAATTNFDGDRATVLRVDKEAMMRYPDLTVRLSDFLNDRNIQLWKSITEQVLVSPERRYRGLSLRQDSDITIRRDQLSVSVDRTGWQARTFPLKFTYLKAIFDTEPQHATFYEPDPYSGRPQLRIGALDLFTDTRKALLTERARLLDDAQHKHLERLKHARKEIMLNTVDSKTERDPFIAQAIQMYDEAPLLTLHVIARIAYYDNLLKNFQPIDVAGLLLVEKVDGTLEFKRLAPWISHVSWQQMGEDPELTDRYHAGVYQQLDQSLRMLANHISGIR